MSSDLPSKSKWNVEETTNPLIFPRGSRQTLIRREDESYELRWHLRDGDGWYFVQILALAREGDWLRNRNAPALVNGHPHGVYSVEVRLDENRGKDWLYGTSAEAAVPGANTPGPIVGQWGAESVPTLPEEWQAEAALEGSGAGRTAEPAVG